MMFLTRKMRFSAAHLCRNTELTNAKNWRGYSDCSSGKEYCHNYLGEFTFSGPVDPLTGVVLNLGEIKKQLEKVITPVGLSHSDPGSGFIDDFVPTSEILIQILWKLLEKRIKICRLMSIRLHESPQRNVEFIGDKSMIYVTRSVEFSAAHRLHSIRLSDEENIRIFGKCTRPHGHGHNYELAVTVGGAIDEATGVVIEMGRFDDILQREVLDRYDHRHLNHDVEEFQSINPTSEELLRVIWKRLAPLFTKPVLYKLRLVETSNNVFEYFGEKE